MAPSKKDISWFGAACIFLWLVFIWMLVFTIPQNATIHSQMVAARLWFFEADMDQNGVTTISDIWLWVQWLFFYPGDFLILGIMKFGDIHTFFELSSSTFGNWFSGIISFIFWFAIILKLVIFFFELRFGSPTSSD